MKRFFCILMVFLVANVFAASPSFQSFDQNKFTTNGLTIGLAPGAVSATNLSTLLTYPPILAPTIQFAIPTNNVYESFPKLASSPDGSTIYCSYYSSTAHAGGPGVLRLAISTNGASTWFQSPTIITNAGIDSRDQAFGVTSRGRLILLYGPVVVASSEALPVQTLVSDNGGASWTITGTIDTNNNVSAISFAPYGKVRERNGTLYVGYYVYKDFSSLSEIYVLSSTNWGQTWTRTLIDSNSIAMSEPDVFPLPGSDSILVIARQENASGRFLKSYLSTNGLSFSSMMLPYQMSAQSAKNPMCMELIEGVSGPEMLLVQGFRAETNAISSTWPLGEAGITTNALVSKQTIARISDSNPRDGGYASTLRAGFDDILVSYYYANGPFTVGASDLSEIRFARFRPQVFSKQVSVFADTVSSIPLSVRDESGLEIGSFRKGGGVWAMLLDDQSSEHMGRIAYPLGGGFQLHNINASISGGPSITVSGLGNNSYLNAAGITLQAADGGAVELKTFNGSSTFTNARATYGKTTFDGNAVFTAAPSFVTNSGPANVTIGTTAPDVWLIWTNGSTRFYTPGWIPH